MMCKTFNFALLALLGMLSSNAMSTARIQILDQEGQPVPNAVVAYATQAEQSPSEQPAIMDQIDVQFDPRVLVVQQGQQVKFPNSDNVRHHVYSFSAPKPFEIRLYSGSNSPPVMFDKEGIVVLGCNIHDQMVGYIYVADNEIAQVTDPQGWVTLSEAPDSVTVWHERLSTSKTERLSFAVSLQDDQTASLSLELLAEKPVEKARTFGSKRFGSGDE